MKNRRNLRRDARRFQADEFHRRPKRSAAEIERVAKILAEIEHGRKLERSGSL